MVFKESFMNQNLEIIKAFSEQDFFELASIAKIIWEEHYIPIIGIEQTSYMLDKFQSAAAIKDQIEKQRIEYYFIVQDGKTIGYIAFRNEADAVFLSKYYVQKEHRGLGFGRTALDFVKAFAQQNNKDKIYLTVNRDNNLSIQQYHKMGFKITEEINAEIGNGYFMNDYIMELSI